MLKLGNSYKSNVNSYATQIRACCDEKQRLCQQKAAKWIDSVVANNYKR